MNKKGQLGEYTLMIYRLILITVIALVVLGISAVSYKYDINIRNMEAQIMTVKLVECFSHEGIYNESEIGLVTEEMEENVLDYCGIEDVQKRFYVIVLIENEDGYVKAFRQGDSGAKWARDTIDSLTTTLFRYKVGDEVGESTKKLKNYIPGHYKESYTLKYEKDGSVGYEGSVKLHVEVLVNADV